MRNSSNYLGIGKMFHEIWQFLNNIHLAMLNISNLLYRLQFKQRADNRM